MTSRDALECLVDELFGACVLLAVRKISVGVGLAGEFHGTYFEDLSFDQSFRSLAPAFFDMCFFSHVGINARCDPFANGIED